MTRTTQTTRFPTRLFLFTALSTLIGTGCGGTENLGEIQSAVSVFLGAVRPNASPARFNITGTPDDVNLANDLKDPAPDFNASYVTGGSASSQSSVDLAYPAPSPDGPVTQVNVKYLATNVLCTAAGSCGTIWSVLLNGNTVLATAPAHQLPTTAAGWYMYGDTFNVPAGQLPSVANLRTRIVFQRLAPYSPSAIRVTIVASDITYNQ
jgi:hypothetical protein